MRRAASFLACAGLVGLLAPGCFGHECEGDVYPLPPASEFGYSPGEGDLLDDATWESVKTDDPPPPTPTCTQKQLGGGSACRALSAWKADASAACSDKGEDLTSANGVDACDAVSGDAGDAASFHGAAYECCTRPAPAAGNRWMDFPPGRTWRVAVPAWTDDQEGRELIAMHGYVSFGPQPNQQVHCGADYCDPADNWSEGTGNLVEFSRVDHGRIRVKNDTCSHFYLRVVLHAGPPTRGPRAVDAAPPR